MYGVTVLARSGSSRFLCPSATYWHGCIDSRFSLPYPTAISCLPQNLPLYSPLFSLLYPTIFSPLPHYFLFSTPLFSLLYPTVFSPLFHARFCHIASPFRHFSPKTWGRSDEIARKRWKYLLTYKKCRNFAPFSGMRGSERAPHFLVIIIKLYSHGVENPRENEGLHAPNKMYDKQRHR